MTFLWKKTVGPSVHAQNQLINGTASKTSQGTLRHRQSHFATASLPDDRTQRSLLPQPRQHAPLRHGPLALAFQQN